MDSYILEVCRKILVARSNGNVRRLLDDLLCRYLGWDNFMYVAHVPTRFTWNTSALMVTNYPAFWLLHYLRKGFYKDDPLVNHCQNHNLPIIWTTDPKDWVYFNSTAKEIAAAARKEGWMGGAAIPIPAVPCRGTFALLTRKTLDSAKSMIDTSLLIGPTIGLHIHDALLEIALNRKFSPLDKQCLYLSDIEKDILQWTAEGMPGKQVADQMGISVKAVERHLEKVRERLKAPNRANMLVMAYAMGLIHTGRGWSHGSIVNAEGYEDRLEKLCSEEVKVPRHLIQDYLCGELSEDDMQQNPENNDIKQ